MPRTLAHGVFAAICVGAATAHAQSMSQRLEDLFRFGSCEAVVCLAPGNDAIDHGHDFDIDAANTAALITGLLQAGIVTSVDNLPNGSTSSGVAFEFSPQGLPVPVSGSEGPLVTERSQTLGRGRALASVQVSQTSFSSVRGVPLSNLRDVYTVETASTPPGSTLGFLPFENDTIGVRTFISSSVSVLATSLTVGLSNRVDLGVTIPVERISFSGVSIASIGNTDGPKHLFGIDSAGDIQTVDTSRSSGTVTGIGDVVAHLKLNLAQSAHGGSALLGEVRLPTGKRSELLGSGALDAAILAVGSLNTGPFGEHANVGYLLRQGPSENSAVLAVAGVEARVLSRLTIAVEGESQWQVGASKILLPAPAHYIDGSNVLRTNIPQMRDDVVDGSFGFKAMLGRGITLIGSALVPLTNGGLRTATVWSAGLQSNF